MLAQPAGSEFSSMLIFGHGPAENLLGHSIKFWPCSC
jgi:hypothetical protein